MNKDIYSLPMTLGEIAESYRSARFKHKQIGILADMNVCSRATVIKALKAAGLSDDELPGEARKSPLQEKNNDQNNTADAPKQKEKNMKKIICEDGPNTASGSKDPASDFIETPKAEPDEEASAADPLFATAPLMRSDDYQKRFLAEYRQLKIRYERLKRFTTWIEAADISSAVTAPKHDCPCDLLREQQDIMDRYLHVLELRAVIERIDLEADDNA